MAHELSRIGPVLFIRWKTEILVPDCLALVSHVEDGRRRAEEPVTLISIFGEGLLIPSAEARTGFARGVEQIRHHCRAVHVVIEGEGFAHATLRSLLTAVNFASRGKQTVTVHSTVEEALKVAGTELRVDPRALMNNARFRRMVA